MKTGEPLDIELTSRYYQFNRSHAITDVFDGLVELITNADDSYHRLYRQSAINNDGGQILIEHLEQRKDKPSTIIVRDRAEGMTLDEMLANLGQVGRRRSQEGDRGFMARGAKDCTELGRMVVESIKNNKYFKCELTTKPSFVPLDLGRRATKELRDALHINRGNGTVVSLEIDARHKLPRFQSIVRDLPWHYALRDILSASSPTKVLLKSLNRSGESAERVIYQRPRGGLGL